MDTTRHSRAKEAFEEQNAGGGDFQNDEADTCGGQTKSYRDWDSVGSSSLGAFAWASCRDTQSCTENLTMRERGNLNPVWVSLVAAIAVIGIILIGYKLLQTQRHVEAVQTELESANARTRELENHATRLSSEREDAVRQRIVSQDKLDEATTERNELQNKLDESTSTIQELQKQLEQAQSAFDDTKFRLTILKSEVESIKQALAEANSRTDSAIANRKELEAKLSVAHSEIDKLKAALERAKKGPAASQDR